MPEEAPPQPTPGRASGAAQAARLVDARVLLWLLLAALATGAPLMLWFDADPARHAARLPAVGASLRALHAAASTLLVFGAALHLVLRLWGRARAATWKGVRTGGIAMLSVAVAAITGALVAQDGNAARLLDLTGLARHGQDGVLVAAVVHIAYASILVLLTAYLHVARWGWAYLLARRVHAVLALGAAGLLALALGAALPGDGERWQGSTWLAVPAVPGLWAWSAALALLTYLFSRRLARRTRGVPAVEGGRG